MSRHEEYPVSGRAEAHGASIQAPPAMLRGAYRLLFIGGSSWAIIVATLWIASYSGTIALPTAMDSLGWHQHEMLFGYLGAVIAGFLSAAIPNWTGRPAFTGMPVGLFFACWLAARLALLFSSIIPLGLAAAIDVGFLLLTAVIAMREIRAARNRNAFIPGVIMLFALADAVHYTEASGAAIPPGLGIRAGFSLVLILICLIGGRIIPAFTRNWLMRQERGHSMPAMPGTFDLLSIGAAALALSAWTARPNADLAGWLLIFAGIVHILRLARWSGHRSWRDPLLLILHVGYFWLPVGFLLLGSSILGTMLPATSALHALAAGAMGTMTLAVMTRATLGHTGRPLKADGWTVAIYLLVTAGALLRVANPLLPFDYMLTLRAAGAAWGAAFLIFLIAYGPMLCRPRVDAVP